MKTIQEFYNWCDLQKQEAIKLCNGNLLLINEVNKVDNPNAQYFEIQDGYLQAPGLKSNVLFDRAKDKIDYNKAMTILQNENKLYA